MTAEVRTTIMFFLVAACAVTWAEASGVKVAGETMLPAELVFLDADPRSQAHAEGALPDGCKWEVRAATRIAPFHSADCVEYFYRTTILLTRRCPAPGQPQVVISERTTSSPRFCVGDEGDKPQLRKDVRPISTGRTPDGRMQDLIEMPDGSRVTISWSDETAEVRVTYPDRTTDVLRLPAEK